LQQACWEEKVDKDFTATSDADMTDSKEIKCVVWDLDDTLWNGTLLESSSVILRPQIKEIIEALDQRGILHSIASRNSFNDAMRKLEEFGLDQYFIHPQINWDAKSVSIGRILKQLKIGVDSLLFIDDQPYERDEVRHHHPEVTCVASEQYLGLPDYRSLNPKFITEDSRRRRRMYQDDIKRTQEETVFQGPEAEFLQSLNMRFLISRASETDLQRAEELTRRTHQLNATGKTYDYEELNAFRNSRHHELLICELDDRYGSYGKIGLALLEKKEKCNHLLLMLMSCRVMSRGVGTILLSYLMHLTKNENKTLLADFKPTPNNRVMYVSYKFANFRELEHDPDGNILLENDLSVIQNYPHHVEITIN
jgi:FkbH-like protein